LEDEFRKPSLKNFSNVGKRFGKNLLVGGVGGEKGGLPQVAAGKKSYPSGMGSTTGSSAQETFCFPEARKRRRSAVYSRVPPMKEKPRG